MLCYLFIYTKYHVYIRFVARVVEARVISEHWRLLMEKHRVSHKELHCAFVDVKREYDRVPREEL